MNEAIRGPLGRVTGINSHRYPAYASGLRNRELSEIAGFLVALAVDSLPEWHVCDLSIPSLPNWVFTLTTLGASSMFGAKLKNSDNMRGEL
jgi:hypothetical protein